MFTGYVKTNGAVFNRFCNDGWIWANGEYVDDAEIFINGKSADRCPVMVEPEDEVLILGGFMCRTVGRVPLPFFFQSWRAFLDSPEQAA